MYLINKYLINHIIKVFWGASVFNRSVMHSCNSASERTQAHMSIWKQPFVSKCHVSNMYCIPNEWCLCRAFRKVKYWKRCIRKSIVFLPSVLVFSKNKQTKKSYFLASSCTQLFTACKYFLILEKIPIINLHISIVQ